MGKALKTLILMLALGICAKAAEPTPDPSPRRYVFVGRWNADLNRWENFDPAQVMQQGIIKSSPPAGGGGGNAFTFVKSSTGATDSGGIVGSALTGSFTPGAAGHALIAYGIWSVASGSATGAFTDNNGNTWTKCGTPSPTGGQQGTGTLAAFYGIAYYTLAANSGATTISLTTSGSNATNFRSFAVSEFSYTGTAAIDVVCTYSDPVAASSLITSSSITTAITNELVLAACMVVDNNCTVGTGYSSADNGWNAGTGALVEYKTQSTATSGITATWGATTGNNSIVTIAALKAQ